MNYYEKWKLDYGLEYIRRYAEDGLDDNIIAERIGVKPTTFRRWKKKYPEVCEALFLGRIGSDYAVVEALYKKATGYKVKVNKTVKLKHSDFDPETGKKIRDYEELATAVDESYIPADIRAGLFWLKNRQPERWSEKQESDMQSNFAGVIEIPEADRIDEEDGDE